MLGGPTHAGELRGRDVKAPRTPVEGGLYLKGTLNLGTVILRDVGCDPGGEVGQGGGDGTVLGWFVPDQAACRRPVVERVLPFLLVPRRVPQFAGGQRQQVVD